MDSEGKNLKIGFQKGSILLELALIMPVFILLLAGIIQFGFLFFAKISVTAASYEAARPATLSENPEAAAVKAAEEYAGGSLPGWDYSERLKTNVFAADTTPGSEVSVEVIYSVPVFFQSISALADSGSFMDVSGLSVMRIEEKE